MADKATPNLPSRDLGATAAFYQALGFTVRYRDPVWMILDRGTLTLEFFAFPDLDPATSSHGCCLRIDDLDELYAACRAAEIPEAQTGWPRLHPPVTQHWGARMASLIDLDCSLLRLIQNQEGL